MQSVDAVDILNYSIWMKFKKMVPNQLNVGVNVFFLIHFRIKPFYETNLFLISNIPNFGTTLWQISIQNSEPWVISGDVKTNKKTNVWNENVINSVINSNGLFCTVNEVIHMFKQSKAKTKQCLRASFHQFIQIHINLLRNVDCNL